jgi:3-methyladenine DNA glycosylase AlkD
MNIKALKSNLRKLIDPEKTKIFPRFFKSGPGEYGEGDKFLGISVPNCRTIAKQHQEQSLNDLKKLISSKYHEERLVALLILIIQYQKGDQKTKQIIYNFYLQNTQYINNWDLVDLSCYKIIGNHLLDKDRQILCKLAKSKDLWEKRIAIISTYAFIKQDQFKPTLEISKVLLKDSHDLIHKAVGWMLREVGKKDKRVEEKFLKVYYQSMPRTMLRYAIEKFPENIRQQYLKGTI